MSHANISKLDLKQLRLVEALVRTNSLTASAEQVGLSQPAASHALARLRKLMGEPLFVRTSAGMRPTPFGKHFGASVSDALGALRAGLEAQPTFDPGTARRTFNIYMTDVGQMVFLPPLLAKLKTAAPKVSLRVRAVPVRSPHILLESGEIDIAAGHFTTLTHGIYQRQLFRERYVCAVRAGHPDFSRGMTIEAFRSVPHAFTDSGGLAHETLDRTLVRQKIKREIKLRVPEFMVLPLVISNSDLLVIMPSRLADQFAKLVQLKLMPLPFSVPTYDIKVYWHERFRRDPAVRWLIDVFVSLFARPTTSR